MRWLLGGLAVASVAASAASAQVGGGWVEREVIDPMTDFEGIAFSRLAEDTIRTGFRSTRPLLTISCLDDSTAIYVDWQTYITTGGIRGRTPVTYRVNDGGAVNVQWHLSTNFEATGLWRGQGIGLLREIYRAGDGRFLVQTTPYGENDVLAEFTTTGIREVIETVSERCNWTVSGPTALSGRPVGGEGQGALPVGELAAADQAMIEMAVRACWNFDLGAPGALTYRITIAATMGADGMVRSAEIRDTEGDAPESAVLAAAQGALRAVTNPRCQPWPVPTWGWQEGREVVLTFNPSQIF